MIGSKKAGGIAIPAGQEKAILKSLSDAEGLIRHDRNRETFVAFNSTGKGVFVKREAGLSVDIGKNIRDYPALFEGATLTHNHPNSSAFSREDVETTCLANAAEIRIAGTLYDYSLRPATGNFSLAMWENLIKPVYMRQAATLRMELQEQFARMEPWEFERLYTHELWQRVADDDSAELVYNRKNRSEKEAKP